MNKTCEHYKNNCTFKASCCDKFYDCKRCHDSKLIIEDLYNDKENDHIFICTEIKCLNCETIQSLQQYCENCKLCLGNYFCKSCIILENEKEIFHCDKCGICRLGKRDNYFHCETCDCCINIASKDIHICTKNALKRNCSICYEYLHTSRESSYFLKCGHALHAQCLEMNIKNNDYRCPVCRKSAFDMSSYFEQLDEEIQLIQMPEEYRNKIVKIFCNDCESNTETNFHIIGMKCSVCKSYNTTQI